MARRSNLDWYQDRLAVIEQQFRADWLTEQLTPDALGRRPVHPIAANWVLARRILDQAQVSHQLEPPIEFFELCDLAGDLEAVQNLPGYTQAITPAKLQSDFYTKECHVAHVAALGIRSEYQVEFIPESTVPGEKTPD